MPYQYHFSVDRNKRISVNEDLIRNLEGILMHCSSIVINGNSYLFTGVSGAGKSTIAKRILNHDMIINEDRNLIVFGGDQLLIKSAPLKGDEQERDLSPDYLHNLNLTASLKKIFFIEKEFSKRSYVEKVEDEDYCWTFLLKQTAPPVKDRSLTKNYLKVIDKIVDKVPFYIFHHNMNDSRELIESLIIG